MDNIACPLCSSESYNVGYTNLLDGRERQLASKPEGMQVVKCSDCSLLYFNPLDSDNDRRYYYNEAYFVSLNEREQIGYPNYLDKKHIKSKEMWSKEPLLRWFKSHHSNPGSILDTGCATGSLMKAMLDEKWKCLGIDISEFIIDNARLLYPKTNFICADASAITYPIGKFDCILLWDSIEHFRNIHALMNLVYKSMNDKSIGVIQTPDGEYAEDDWYYWSPHQHVCIFTLDTLKQLLELHGLVIIEEMISPEPDELIVIFGRK